MRSSLFVAVLLLAGGCTRVTDGIEVDVAYQTPPMPQAVQTSENYRVWVAEALIVLGPVELVKCDSFARGLRTLFAPARAKAHELETPTSLGAPFVLDLVEGVGPGLFVGTIRPPPGRYCGIRVVAAPADADAVGLEGRLEMLKSSVFVSGEVEDPTTGVREPLVVPVSVALSRVLEFEEPLVFDAPRGVGLSVTVDPLRWFDGIDFAQISRSATGPVDKNASASFGEQLIENIRSSLTVTSLYE